MAEEKKERQSEGTIVVGREKDDAGGDEVAGREKGIIYTCFICGAANYVPLDATTFSCWRCSSIKTP